ncbi:hypothetical protein F7647_08335 [Tenacibaculum piscium]|nr:hypothetical protein [Tenacibaculum piscium]
MLLKISKCFSYFKRTLVVFLAMSVHFFYAQNTNISTNRNQVNQATIYIKNQKIPEKETQIGFGAVDFLSIKMPKNKGKDEKNMGFTGIHYNLKLNDWSYAGLGIYGAVTGIRGGFFTLGINAGIQQKISKNMFVDAGVHLGGGGGASAPDGGGAFILPHLNLGYNFGYFSTTAGYSYVNFFDKGAIKNHQFNVAIQIPLSFETADFKQRERVFNFDDFENLKNTSWNTLSNRISLLVHLNNLSVKKGNYKGKTMRLAGFELNSYFNKNMFFFVKADGAYHGIKAGYMDVFLGAGYHISMNKNRTNILAKFGIGAGGGGGVETKGGFLIYPDISIEQKVLNNMYVSVNKGFLMSPDAHFSSNTLGFGLKYYLDKDGITPSSAAPEKSFSSAKLKGLEVIIKQDLYLNASRIVSTNKNKKDLEFDKNMHQISLQINLFLNKYIYGAGQTSFANFGDAGAYAEGIVGLGVQSARFLNNRTSVFAQVLAGAAGGGGIGTGEGLIVKPSIGINHKLTNKLNARAGFGYVKARGGNLSNPYLNIGLSYRFSFLSVE